MEKARTVHPDPDGRANHFVEKWDTTVLSTYGVVQADEGSAKMFGPVHATVPTTPHAAAALGNESEVPATGSESTQLTASNDVGPSEKEATEFQSTHTKSQSHTSPSASTVESRLRNESYPITSRLNLSAFGKNRNDILLLETPEKTEFVSQVVRENRLPLLSFHVIFAEGFHSI